MLPFSLCHTRIRGKKMKARLIVNGKKAGDLLLREAVNRLRGKGYELEVRTTWESGDVERLCDEAHREGFSSPETRLVIGGGDGSIHEIVNALMRYDEASRPSIGILPMGTANDFAKSCELPVSLLDAMKVALAPQSRPLDIVACSRKEHAPVYFANMLTAGFGAQVTAQTPVELKNMLGGSAYTLAGLVQARSFKPFSLDLESDEVNFSGEIIAAAICNGRFAGGGQELGKSAVLDDGLLQVCILADFPATAVAQVLKEIAIYNQTGVCHGDYLKGFKCKAMSAKAKRNLPTNLDGEPHVLTESTFSVRHRAIHFAIPAEN